MNLNIVFILTLFVFVLSNPIIHDEEIDFNLTFNQRDSTKEKEEIVNNSIYVVIVVIILILVILVLLLIFCVWFCFCKKIMFRMKRTLHLKFFPIPLTIVIRMKRTLHLKFFPIPLTIFRLMRTLHLKYFPIPLTIVTRMKRTLQMKDCPRLRTSKLNLHVNQKRGVNC